MAVDSKAVNDEPKAQDQRNGRDKQAVSVCDLLACVQIEVLQTTSANRHVLLQRLVQNDQEDENGVDDCIRDDDVAGDCLIDAIARDIGPPDDASNKHPEDSVSAGLANSSRAYQIMTKKLNAEKYKKEGNSMMT